MIHIEIYSRVYDIIIIRDLNKDIGLLNIERFFKKNIICDVFNYANNIMQD